MKIFLVSLVPLNILIDNLLLAIIAESKGQAKRIALQRYGNNYQIESLEETENKIFVLKDF